MKTLIIAEAGVNHNGSISMAKELIDVAVDAGCDAVKFQKRDIDQVYTNDFLDSPRESPWGKTQREQKKGIEFGYKEYIEIDHYCKNKNIKWFFRKPTVSRKKTIGYNIRMKKISFLK